MSARSLTLALGGWRTREPAYEALLEAPNEGDEAKEAVKEVSSKERD